MARTSGIARWYRQKLLLAISAGNRGFPCHGSPFFGQTFRVPFFYCTLVVPVGVCSASVSQQRCHCGGRAHRAIVSMQGGAGKAGLRRTEPNMTSVDVAFFGIGAYNKPLR
jgi:hypothetical protein